MIILNIKSNRVIRTLIDPDFDNEFNTAYYTINLIFSQSVVWMGTYYSPFLMGLQLIKTLVVFIIRYVSLAISNII